MRIGELGFADGVFGFERAACDTVWGGVFLHVETDWGFGRRRGWLQKGAEFLVDVAQGVVMEQQGFVDFGQALEDGCVGGLVLAHFDKRANDVEAHGL